MKGFKRYERYKNSGVEWIGEIPEHWGLSKIKYFYDVCLGKMIQPEPKAHDDTLEYYLCSVNVTWNGIDISNIKQMCFSSFEKKKYALKAGDLIINEGGDAGRAAIWDAKIERCYIQNAVHRVRAKVGSSNRFLYYWIYFIKNIGYIDLVCNKATIMHYTSDKLLNTIFVTPPTNEQQAIANFLYQKTAEIDSLIVDKEKLIELLQEQRQAIITQAVTKGLDPNVPMKDSGIEWLGEIPEHWLTVVVKRVYDIKLGKMLQPIPNKSDDVLVPYLKALHVQWEKIEVDEYTEMWASPKDIEMFSVEPGDLLVCEGGEVGRAAILENLNRQCIIQNSLHRIRPSLKAKCKYLLYILQIISQKSWLDVLCNKATIAHFTSDKLGNLRIPLPPKEEQEKIIKRIENEVEFLDNYISCEREIIEKLKEYRQSLITAAVTGKIDVRNCNVKSDQIEGEEQEEVS